jgi:uncharacterized protein YcbK (DUF882 family)
MPARPPTDGAWFEHYSEVTAWHWPHFSPFEIACKGTKSLLISDDALYTLERMRVAVGRPMTVWSAYRSEAHNASIHGAPLSQHLFCTAFDIPLAGHDRDKLKFEAEQAGFTGFGFYNTFLHIDIGRKRTWGKWK